MESRFETSRRPKLLILFVFSLISITFIARSPFYIDILIYFALAASFGYTVVLYLRKTPDVIYEDGHLTVRKYFKYVEYDLKDFDIIQFRNTEDTSMIYGVKLVNGVTKKTKLINDYYALNVRRMYVIMHAFYEELHGNDTEELMQLEHQVKVISTENAVVILSFLSIIINAFAMFQFYRDYQVVMAGLSFVLLCLYAVYMKKIAMSKKLYMAYSTVAFLLTTVTFALFFLTAGEFL
jgi:hypothetical protein